MVWSSCTTRCAHAPRRPRQSPPPKAVLYRSSCARPFETDFSPFSRSVEPRASSGSHEPNTPIMCGKLSQAQGHVKGRSRAEKLTCTLVLGHPGWRKRGPRREKSLRLALFRERIRQRRRERAGGENGRDVKKYFEKSLVTRVKKGAPEAGPCSLRGRTSVRA